MSVLHYHQDRPRTRWLPLPSLTDALGVLAIVVKVALGLRNARHATTTKESR